MTDLTDSQKRAARLLLWAMIGLIVTLTAHHIISMRAAQREAQASVDRMLSAPLVIYPKPRTVHMLDRVYRVEPVLAVPERSEP